VRDRVRSWGLSQSLAILICSYFFDSQIFALEETILFQFLDERRKTQSDGIKVRQAGGHRGSGGTIAEALRVYDIMTNPTNVTVVVS
jgi:hypothetical protein